MNSFSCLEIPCCVAIQLLHNKKNIGNTTYGLIGLVGIFTALWLRRGVRFQKREREEKKKRRVGYERKKKKEKGKKKKKVNGDTKTATRQV